MAAYNARLQRGRDACKNIVDTLESVAKEVYRQPTASFRDVLNEMKREQPPRAVREIVSVLEKLYVMSNSQFRHGMTTPFMLRATEVDFVMVSCMGGILLFVRL